MTLRVSGKNLDIGVALRAHIGAALESVIAKYCAEPMRGHVTIEREGSGFRTDCSLHFDSGTFLQVEAEAQDAYASFNKAADRVESRLRRTKRRLRTRNGTAMLRAVADDQGVLEADANAPEAAAEGTPLVIAEPVASLKKMSVSSAVKVLDAGNAPVVTFRHAGDGCLNVVYRRPDGHIGWIDTAAWAADSAL